MQEHDAAISMRVISVLLFESWPLPWGAALLAFTVCPVARPAEVTPGRTLFLAVELKEMQRLGGPWREGLRLCGGLMSTELTIIRRRMRQERQC